MRLQFVQAVLGSPIGSLGKGIHSAGADSWRGYGECVRTSDERPSEDE